VILVMYFLFCDLRTYLVNIFGLFVELSSVKVSKQLYILIIQSSGQVSFIGLHTTLNYKIKFLELYMC
jgi:hypothetical protein